MDFKNLLKTRRAVRAFQNREVPENLIMEIIADSCEAPSGHNKQPWSFIVIKNKTIMKRISDESKKNILALMDEKPGSFLPEFKPIMAHKDFYVFYDAPCLVYIAGQKEIRSLDIDCTLAASYFMLSAADRGLGTCWVDFGSIIEDQDLRMEIGLPDDYRIVATLILGYPEKIPNRPQRKEPVILKFINPQV
ncbi:MAG TPA: nitroreductase family protein [Smithella sp.]|nr:nitroreductase family protein [Smithella sp.]